MSSVSRPRVNPLMIPCTGTAAWSYAVDHDAVQWLREQCSQVVTNHVAQTDGGGREHGMSAMVGEGQEVSGG